jgi:hypothetical protein
MSSPTLPADVARCPGEGSMEDEGWNWREGCDDCLRRTAPGPRTMTPPVIVVFECECRIAPGEASRC